MKNPNGYGSVVKLSGNRRKPYTARKTTGWNDKGHPIYLTIGYYATRQEGMIALAEYNKNPFDINASKMTFEEVYQKWLVTKYPKLSEALQRNLKTAHNHCKNLYGMKYKEIRSFHMQDCIDNCGCGYSTQGSIKNLFGHLDRFAMELDVIQKMYSSLTTSEPIPESGKEPFSDQEVEVLWQHKDEPWVWSVLLMLYSGWRITEFVTLKTADINLEAETMMGGIKTRNGKERIVPIHSEMIGFVKQHYDETYKTFIHDEAGQPMTADDYRSIFNEIMKRFGMDHTPHETRHTFRSRLDSAGANKKCIDLMMGHKSKDVGERVYTHKTVQELKDAIEKISR